MTMIYPKQSYHTFAVEKGVKVSSKSVLLKRIFCLWNWSPTTNRTIFFFLSEVKTYWMTHTTLFTLK